MSVDAGNHPAKALVCMFGVGILKDLSVFCIGLRFLPIGD